MLTVGELRRALEGVPDHVPVILLVYCQQQLEHKETEAAEVRYEFNRLVIE